jgi:hypothetical protein
VSREQRQKVVLAALLAVLGVVLWRQLSGGDPPPAARSLRAGRSGGSSRERDLPELEVARLAAVRAVYVAGRDPFRYGPEPAPPPDERTPAEIKEERRNRQERAAAGEEGNRRGAQPQGPRVPEIDVSYLGSFGPQDDRIAVFLHGEEIINAKVGDVLEGRFVVQGIGFESVDLGFVGFPEEPSQRLPAGG